MRIRERVKTGWWRVALVAAAAVVTAFSRDDPFAGVFGLVPILVWCGALARSPRTGVTVGLVLVALLAWFVLPRELGLAGPWVPWAVEVYWLHTALAAVVCAIGALVERRPTGVVWLPAMVLAGLVVTGFALFSRWETPPGNEGVWPGPAQLRITEHESCGSHSCSRILEATGDRAPEVLREHLAAGNFTPAPPSGITRLPRFCRSTGVVVTHTVCAELRTLAANAAQVEWYVN
jgi:hypothetical protein